MTKHQPALLLLSLLTSVGCAADPDSRSPYSGTDGKADGQICDASQTTAAAYYRQFAYRKLDASDQYILGSSFYVRAWLPNRAWVDLDVYLLPEHRVVARYTEVIDTHGSNDTVVITRYEVDEATKKLTLIGLGEGVPVKVTTSGFCGPGIDFTFTRDVKTVGLAGLHTEIIPVVSNMYIIDPDHLDQVPTNVARHFEEDVANGYISIVRI